MFFTNIVFGKHKGGGGGGGEKLTKSLNFLFIIQIFIELQIFEWIFTHPIQQRLRQKTIPLLVFHLNVKLEGEKIKIEAFFVVLYFVVVLS